MTSPHAVASSWRRFHVFPSSSDLFIALTAPAVIWESDYFDPGLRYSAENRSISVAGLHKTDPYDHLRLRCNAYAYAARFHWTSVLLCFGLCLCR